MPKLLHVFDEFPAERDAIGRMLIAYGDIEFGLLMLVSAALSNDTDTAMRILFRARGESARIEIADALIRPGFKKVDLDGKWSNAYGAAKICKNIRNQYAHCHWLPVGSIMTFLDFDSDARQPEGEIKLTQKTFNLVLLSSQQQYFEYCLEMIWFLEQEYKKRAGLPVSDLLEPEPKSRAAPLLYIPYK
jgi:hypothetical protein